MSVTLAMDVTYVLLLGSLGLAITTQAQNCPTPVAGNNMWFKGTLPTTFPDGTIVVFQCNTGYRSAGGSPRITCTDGTWSPVLLTCKKKSCGSAGEVLNGDIHYEGIEFGDQLVVTCKHGYYLTGKKTIYCGADGWLSRLPKCDAVSCSVPESLTNGSFSPIKESYFFPEVVQYECKKGYTLSGSRSSSCSANETFTPPPPTCITLVQCKEPDVTNGKVLSGSRPPFTYKSSVTFQCHPGYNMKGDPDQKCDLDSQWAPGLPTCEPVLCEDPIIKNAAKEEGSMPPYKFNSMVTFSCISGYSMMGDHTQTCGQNGQWAPGLPTCELVPTTKRPSTTKKPIDDSEKVDPTGNNGNGMALGLGLGLTVFIGCVLTVLGCYFCGVPPCIKKKKRSRRGFPGNVAPTADEEVALS
ncbi:complement component receptor 1-like protein isoform 2-T3 [Spinachia spinachia]